MQQRVRSVSAMHVILKYKNELRLMGGRTKLDACVHFEEGRVSTKEKAVTLVML